MKKRTPSSPSSSSSLKPTGRALILLVHDPESEKVKPKLARSLGRQKAASLYREMTEKTWEAIQPFEKEYAPLVFYDPASRREVYKKWLGEAALLFPQKGGQLGERLKNALSQTLRNYAEVIVMGSDKPSLSRAHLAQAFEAFEDSEVVLGPTSEGGFYLMGFRKLIPDLFEKTLWSTPFAFDTLFKVLTGLGIDPHLLPVMTDESP